MVVLVELLMLVLVLVSMASLSKQLLGIFVRISAAFMHTQDT